MSLVLHKKHSRESICGMNDSKEKRKKKKLITYIYPISFPYFYSNCFFYNGIYRIGVRLAALGQKLFCVNQLPWASLDWSKPQCHRQWVYKKPLSVLHFQKKIKIFNAHKNLKKPPSKVVQKNSNCFLYCLSCPNGPDRRIHVPNID